MSGLLSEDSSQLSALASLVQDDQPGARYSGADVRRATTASNARASMLRKLYTPASVRAGRPLVCVSAARLYDEVPVCHECYQVYSQLADEWKRHPRALLSVASAPALGLIGAHISELPSELLGESELEHEPDARGQRATAAGAAKGGDGKGGGSKGGSPSGADAAAGAPPSTPPRVPSPAGPDGTMGTTFAFIEFRDESISETMAIFNGMALFGCDSPP